MASTDPARGAFIDDALRPISDRVPRDHRAGLRILGRQPFNRCIASSYAMGAIVGNALATALARAPRAAA